MADSQANKVLKMNILGSGIEFSVSSELLLFLFFQMHHIKQWGIIIQIWLFPDDQNDLADCDVILVL